MVSSQHKNKEGIQARSKRSGLDLVKAMELKRQNLLMFEEKEKQFERLCLSSSADLEMPQTTG